MSIVSPRSGFKEKIRLAGIVGICAAAMSLSGCVTLEAPTYQPSHANVRTLKGLPAEKVAVGEFTAKSPDLNHLSIRASNFESPFDKSYAEYLKQALLSELETAGRSDPNSAVVITGELQTNVINAGPGTGTSDIAARIIVKRNNNVVFDKVVRGHNEWKSAFLGDIGIPAAQQQYTETVKIFLVNLFADPDFKQAF